MNSKINFHKLFFDNVKFNYVASPDVLFTYKMKTYQFIILKEYFGRCELKGL